MNVETTIEEKQVQKNNRIRKTMNATKNTRKNQRCRVYEVKIMVNKLSCEKKAHINRLFLEGKWLWNYTLGQKDVFSVERCPKSVLVNTIGSFADRELCALGSQMKQDIVDSVKTAIKILATSKKKGEKVGRIKLRILIKTAAGRIGSGHLFSFNLTSYSHPIRPKAGTSNPSINNSQTVSR